MSEVIIQPPGTQVPQFGLQVISEQPVRLIQEIPNSTIVGLGSAAADTIRPDDTTIATPLRLLGEAGDDTLGGGAGIDILSGDAGDDTIAAASGDDVIVGGGGNDSLLGEAGDDVAIGGLGNDFLAGGDGSDVLRGNLGNDRILGGAGSDSLLGDVGDDFLFGNEDDDWLSGGAGSDRLDGNDGDDFVAGGTGNDILSGGDGDDVIVGGAGNDLLNPGAGEDVMRGGAGGDRFRFERNSTGRGQLDTVIDFQPGTDTLQISAALLPGSGLRPGRLRGNDFQAVNLINPTSTGRIVYERRTGLLYYNPASGVDVPLLKVQANLNLTANDISIF